MDTELTVAWKAAPVGVSEIPLGRIELTVMVVLVAGKFHVMSQFGTAVGTSHDVSTTAVSRTRAMVRRIMPVHFVEESSVLGRCAYVIGSRQRVKANDR